ncbi:MAG TPA: sigma-70 family RNA polymerase sigma factor [Planctomycetota bacterium]|nr:sigma-70 family RNA polymerase sigma factor [Planctomycetota bacterium]
MDVTRLADGELARRYAEDADPGERETAFRALVERHGAMVETACRRIVGDGDAAADAAQAVFLVLARKAGSLTAHPSLGGWLHRVACHVAWRLRDAERARDRRERAVAGPVAGGDASLARFELREALDVALDRLPARYRAPLVLHYLEGRSQDEVARALKLKAGTLASLLSRGRDLLRVRLVRQGLASGSAAAFLSALAPLAAAACEPAFVTTVTRTAKLVALAGTAEAAAGAKVAALSAGTLHAMSMLKLKCAAAVLAAAMMVSGGVGFGLAANAGEAPPAPAVEPVAVPGPEEAVLAPVRALRANDAQALAACWPEKQQQRAATDWAKPSDNQWQNRLIDQALATASAEGGAAQIAQFISPFIGRFLGESRPDETVGALARALLADGLETEQTAALKPVREAFAAWREEVDLSEPERLNQACEHLIGALKALDVKDTAALKALDLPSLLGRAGGSIESLKKALSAFDIEADAFLDSITVAEVREMPDAGENPARTLMVTYTAFGKELTMPVKAVQKDGRWFIANDSPLRRWLEQPRGRGWGGQGRRGGQGRGPAGPAGDGGAGPAPQTPPPGDSNF